MRAPGGRWRAPLRPGGGFSRRLPGGGRVPPRRWRRSTWVAVLVALAMIALALIAERIVPLLDGAVRVADGDSFEIGGERVRLEGIDAPELHQSCGAPEAPWPCGERARQALQQAVAAAGKDGVTSGVTCRPVDDDRYGRAVSICTAGGRDLGARMVREGWAVATSYAYRSEEAAARAAGRGIWSGPFELPADFRARQR
ncbi:endonuclease YncB(thermonuclease family) [Ancylobacter sp. 3268]|uniref:thermonuclease family protein n=1 Tax=Ancylobacter sp. 3268 TaxID=2817752 RepID=UPI00285697FC|nr:thermonuclease family protein [Ancylobacter sp. 3268]MDR6954073.1 endonuclease YncB(thermonuclease family) [Ancylobacter sp. 3268]